MDVPERCPVCDRAVGRAVGECDNAAARLALFGTEDNRPRKRTPRQAESAQRRFEDADKDCTAHGVDWRARALAAERHRALAGHLIDQIGQGLGKALSLINPKDFRSAIDQATHAEAQAVYSQLTKIT